MLVCMDSNEASRTTSDRFANFMEDNPDRLAPHLLPSLIFLFFMILKKEDPGSLNLN